MAIDCKGQGIEECSEIIVKALEDSGYPMLHASGEPCGHISISHGDPHRIWIFYYDTNGVHESCSSALDKDIFQGLECCHKALTKPSDAMEIKTLIEAKQISASKKWKLAEVNSIRTRLEQKIQDAKDGITTEISPDKKRITHVSKVQAKHDNRITF